MISKFKIKCRTLFLSDLHLGSTSCQADKLLELLRHVEPEKIYLIGDIIDLWALSKRSYWPTEHNTFIQKILKMARAGIEVIYVPGNHDEPVRDFHGMEFGNVKVRIKDTHVLADGKRMLIVHGDEFDNITRYHRWIAQLGSEGYELLLQLSRFVRFVQKCLGLPSRFSLAKFVKFKVKNAVQFISDYETSIINALVSGNYDGVICGHIHHPDIKIITGKDGKEYVYANDGDFCESLSAIIEDQDGKLEIIEWEKDDAQKTIDSD